MAATVKKKAILTFHRRLTQAAIDRLEATGQQALLWDTETKGLGVRIYATGRRVYVMRLYRRGRRRIITIGDVTAVPLVAARAAAAQIMYNHTVAGLPLFTKRGGKTVREIVQTYLDVRRARGDKAVDRSQRQAERLIYPTLGDLFANELKAATVEQWHKAQTATYLANRALETLTAAYNYARRLGVVDNNPAEVIRAFPERSRRRIMTAAELERFLAALQNENTLTRAAFLLLILTGCRKNEILAAEWNNVDLDNHRLILTDAKTGPRVVVLSDAAVDVFRQLKPLTFPGRYVFPGKTGHITTIDKSWRRCRAAVGAPDLRIHDLRRTVGSALAAAGTPQRVIANVLGHQSLRATEIYTQAGDEQTQKAVQLLASIVLTNKNR